MRINALSRHWLSTSFLAMLLIYFSEALKPFLSRKSPISGFFSYGDWHDLGDLILWIAIFLFAIHVLKKYKNKRNTVWQWDYLCLFGALSLFWAYDVSIAKSHLLGLVGFAAMAYIISWYLDVRTVRSSVVLAGTIIVFWCLIFVVLFPDVAIYQKGRFSGLWRGIFGHKNYLGALASMMCVVFLIEALDTFATKCKMWLVLSVAFALYLLIRSGSTTAIFVSACSVLLLAWLYVYYHRLMSRKWFFRMSILVLLLGVFLLPLVVQLMGKNMTFTGRTGIWQAVVNAVNQKFLTGYGLGNFWLYDVPGYVLKGFDKEKWVESTHNGFLNVALQLGWPALGVFLFLYAKSLWLSFKAFLASETFVSDGLYIFVLLVWFGLANLTESFFFLYKNWFWLLFIIISVMALTKFDSSKSSEHAGVHS